jgi:hypothetical protein
MVRVAPPEVVAARNSNTEPRRLRGQNQNIGIVALAPAAQMKTVAAAALNAAIKAATAAAAAKTAEVLAVVEAKGSKGSLGSSNAITAVVRNSLRPRSSVPRRKKSAVVV